ncbi:putative late embryogenesis abundant protein 2-like [Capsicum annuum]|uniref:golgin subfamily A member 6-like protein 2 n=1 Tax=Capsicum annuum TaxID=4072 RepID=UPI001FB0E449|nr:golgin subfamily A member 6-like protein 2 [Capsicum annuum]KAF3624464.1 putative late embryogenesis abundant protein 2-like [Capsicum annuum]
MGSFQTKEKRYPKAKVVEGLKYNVRYLKAEVNEIMCMREHESQVNAQEMIIFALKEAEWKKERKKLREEVKKLRRKLEAKEEEEEEEKKCNVKEDKEWHQLATSYLFEQIRHEEVRRDEAIDKWKQLYFAIKIELDDLIHRTNQGGLYWEIEQVKLLEELHRELQDKEEKIALLKEEIASKEQEELKREREIDILRQSLKIMSYNMKATNFSKNLSKSLHM